MACAQLDLFSTRQYQDELFGAEYVTLRPIATLDSGPIDFIVENSKEYYDLSETILSLRLKVVNAEGKAIAEEPGNDNVALINNSMHSVFSDVVLMINGKPIEGVPDGLYPYRAYITSLFSYSKAVQGQQLFSEGFVRDDYANMDTVTNDAFGIRKAWTANGNIKYFYGKLNCGIFSQARFMIPGVDIQLRLERCKDSFALVSTNNLLKPKVVILEARLHLLTIKVNPDVLSDHAVILAGGTPAIYEYNKIEIITLPIKENTKNYDKDDVFRGRVPNFLIMFLVSNSAFHGDYALNPFNFKHYNLTSLLLTRDKENIPYERFVPDFKTGNCLREFAAQYQSNNIFGKNAVLPISYAEFMSGYTTFQFNLTDNRRGMNSAPYQNGDVSIDVVFSEPTPETVIMVFYAIFESQIQVFADDRVIVDGV
jgi:hypothetical protein